MDTENVSLTFIIIAFEIVRISEYGNNPNALYEIMFLQRPYLYDNNES